MPEPLHAAAASVPVTERHAVLDILRGFALLGILVMNMPGFSTSMFAEADGSHLWTSLIDQRAEQLRDMLFSGKFNSIFSLLFGIGFTLQYGRMVERDPATAQALYLRRLLVLLALGLVHTCVFWTGDILHVYALLGLLLLFVLRRASHRVLIGALVACALYPVLSGVLRNLFITPAIVAERVREAQAFEALQNAAHGAGGFLDVAALNLRLTVHAYTDPLSLWGNFGGYVMIALTMLLGVLAGRLHWVQRIPELMPRIRRYTWLALALGLACGAAFTIIFELNRTPGPSPIKSLGSLCYSASRVLLMLFYVGVIVQLVQRPAWRRRLGAFEATGRMPLTNYLGQTLICTTIFNAYGLGLWGKVGPAWGLVLALAIFFVVQVPLSLWWLRHHERGPLEAWWSRLTYGRAAGSAPATVRQPGSR